MWETEMKSKSTAKGKIVKVEYEPGAAPRWGWVCECERCAKIPWQKRLHGLFKTEREAEKDFEATALKLTEGWHGVSH
jgi:hypothetical protein